MGLEFAHPQGAKYVMRHLYENGVWAIFSTLDPRVLQFKPGILLRPELCEELLDRTEVAIRKAWAEVRQTAPARREGAGMTPRRSMPASPEAAGRAARPADARAGALGGPGLRDATTAPRCCASSRRSRQAAEDKAEQYAEWAVRETGFGVVEHKVVKNRLCSRGILDAYRDDDFVTPAHRRRAQDRRGAAAGRRRARADPVDQPGRRRSTSRCCSRC